MPIFARRRLQSMLEDLGPRLSATNASDLLTRLEHKVTQSSLAAEFELALLWGIGHVANLKVAPEFPSSRKRPDALSADLFSSGPAVIEITALSDDTFSGQADMDRAANIMAQFAERVRKGASEHLYFEFQVANSHTNGRNRRIRRVTKDFALTPALEAGLKAWIASPDWPTPEAIRLTDEQVDVVVRWKRFVLPLFRSFSSMPAVAYDLEDNHIFKALCRKEKQLSDVPVGLLKCIFLGDAGCRNLRHLSPVGVAETSGEKIIHHFLASSKVDLVCVFSPHSSNHPASPIFTSRFWTATLFDKRRATPASEHNKLAALAEALPRPNLEGNQARALHRQGAFHPQARGQYLAMRVESRRFSMSIKISSRLVLELLAGRISQQQFQDITFGKDKNLFDIQLSRGFTIQSSRIEKAGLDEDDDHLVFDLGHDVAASPLKKPEPTA
jgi:hypothetical protein